MLGSNVAMICRVGNDQLGKQVQANFRRRGVNTKAVQTTKGVSTGIAQITVTDTGDNSIVIVKGANDSLRYCWLFVTRLACKDICLSI